jgi:DNA-binding MarR family transcriptional regulator
VPQDCHEDVPPVSETERRIISAWRVQIDSASPPSAGLFFIHILSLPTVSNKSIKCYNNTYMKPICSDFGDKEGHKDFSKSFMYSIHQLYFLVQKHLEHSLLKEHSKISFSQFMILVGFISSDSGPVSQSCIAEKLYLAEATVSRHISSLVDLGLLSRTEDKANRRKHVIKITPKGTKTFEATSKTINKELDSIFSVIKEKDRTSIIKNFDQVLSLLLKKK